MIRTKEERLSTLERIVKEAFDQVDSEGNPRPNLIAVVQAVKLAHQIANDGEEADLDISPELQELVARFAK